MRNVGIADLGGKRLGGSRRLGGSSPPPSVIDPEDGLTVTLTYAPQDTIPNMSAGASLPIVMAADFTGLDGVTTPGVVFEAGGGGVGALAGFYPDGRFMFRGGSGSTEWNDTTMTYNIVPSGVIHGDGTLVMELDVTTEAITIWWNGVEVGVSAGALSGGWVGSDGGAYLNGKAGSVVSTTVPDAIPAYTTASDLRVYSNQLATR